MNNQKSNQKQKANSSSSGSIIALIVIILAVIVGRAIILNSKHSSNPQGNRPNIPVEPIRENLVTVDLRNEIRNGSLSSSTLFEFFKEKSSKNIYFDEGEMTSPTVASVYRDNGGLKLGTSSKGGSFEIHFNNYTFNRAKVIGRNYTSLLSTGKYSSDSGTFKVNNSIEKEFGTNEDNTQIAPTGEILFTFNNDYDYLKIESLISRITIFQIELWTESKKVENPDDPTISNSGNQGEPPDNPNTSDEPVVETPIGQKVETLSPMSTLFKYDYSAGDSSGALPSGRITKASGKTIGFNTKLFTGSYDYFVFATKVHSKDLIYSYGSLFFVVSFNNILGPNTESASKNVTSNNEYIYYIIRSKPLNLTSKDTFELYTFYFTLNNETELKSINYENDFLFFLTNSPEDYLLSLNEGIEKVNESHNLNTVDETF